MSSEQSEVEASVLMQKLLGARTKSVWMNEVHVC